MREDKFRGIPIGGSEFVYGGLVRANERRGNCLAIKDSTYNINNGYINIIPSVVQPETVGQYTGKKTNGKEIYDGDILSSFVDPEIILKHVVEWSDKYFGWYLWNIKDTARIGDGSVQAFVYFNNTGRDCEIIGNIHENPELLEKPSDL